MAQEQKIIRTLIVRAMVEGGDKMKADLKGIQSAHEQVARTSETSAKGQLSLGDSFAKTERRFNSALRAQQDYEKVQRKVNDAVAQNPALQARANEVLRLAGDHFNKLTVANDNARGSFQRMSQALAAVQGPLGPIAGRLSSMGSLVGGVGLGFAAAAVSIGAIAVALHAAIGMASRFADEMGKLRDTANLIGLNTMQLQAINDAGAEFALTEDKISTALQRFTMEMDEARRGEGNLFLQMQRINPQLALQLAHTTDNTKALDLYGEALSKAGLSTVALSRAGLGRGGNDVGQLLQSIVRGGGIPSLTDAFRRSGDAIDHELIDRVRQLKREIDDMSGDAKRNLASVFAVPLLEAEKQFYETLRDMSRTLKEMGPGEGFRAFMDWLVDPRLVQITKDVVDMVKWANNRMSAGIPTPTGPVKVTVNKPAPASFNDRFSAATDSPLSPFDGDGARATLDLNLFRQRIAAMGDAATAAEQLRLKQMLLDKALRENIITQGDYNRAIGLLDLADRVQKIGAMVSALGSAATVTEQYTARLTELQLQLQRGAISQDTFNRAVKALDTDRSLQQMRDTISALGDAATPAQQYALRIAELKQQLDQGRISQETFTRAVEAAHPVLRQMKDLAASFATTFVQGLLDGKKAIDALIPAMDNLGKELVSAGIKNIIKDPTSPVGYIEAGIGAVVQIATGAQKKREAELKELKDAQAAFAGMADQVRDFNAAAKGFDLSPIAQQIRSITATFVDLASAAIKAKDFGAAAALQQSHSRQVERAIDEFIAPTSVSDAVKGIRNLRSAGDQIVDEYKAAGATAESMAVRQRQISDAVATQVAEMQRQVGIGLQSDINAATGKGYLNDIAELVARFNQLKSEMSVTGVDTALIDRWFSVSAQKIVDGAQLTGQAFSDVLPLLVGLTGGVTQFAEAIEQAADTTAEALAAIQQRIQGYQDRGFAAVTDTSTLSGALAAFDRSAARERAEEIAAGGQAILELESTLAAERYNIQIDFAERSMELQRQAAEQQQQYLEAAYGRIRDFIASLMTGSLSTLSPEQQLSFAQKQFDTTIGNKDLDRVTGDLNTLLTVAQSMFASSVDYANIFSRSTSAASSLIPGFAGGGMVGNGTFNRDSVIAKFAGGGNIGLAGGEFVMPAMQTRSFLPQLEAMRSGGASNDNGAHFAMLAKTIGQAAGAAAMAQIGVLREELAAVRAELRKGYEVTRDEKNRPVRPGYKRAS